jgi:hypothetical protein
LPVPVSEKAASSSASFSAALFGNPGANIHSSSSALLTAPGLCDSNRASRRSRNCSVVTLRNENSSKYSLRNRSTLSAPSRDPSQVMNMAPLM